MKNNAFLVFSIEKGLRPMPPPINFLKKTMLYEEKKCDDFHSTFYLFFLSKDALKTFNLKVSAQLLNCKENENKNALLCHWSIVNYSSSALFDASSQGALLITSSGIINHVFLPLLSCTTCFLGL